jgi:hypothetical protein
MPVSVLQVKTTVTAASLAFNSNVTAGNLIICALSDFTTNAQTATVADGRSTVYSYAVATAGGPQGMRLAYGLAGSSGPCTPAFSYLSGGFPNVVILEVGCSQTALDGTPSALNGVGSNPTPSFTFTTGFAGSLGIVVSGGDHSADTWGTPPAGWTLVQQNGDDAIAVYYSAIASPGTVSPTFGPNPAVGANSSWLAAAFRTVALGGLLINSGMDGGMRPQIKGGMCG